MRQYDNSGVLFRTHLYVPKLHPDSGDIFLEREDEGHVLKVQLYIDIVGMYIYTAYNYRELLSAPEMADQKT